MGLDTGLPALESHGGRLRRKEARQKPRALDLEINGNQQCASHRPMAQFGSRAFLTRTGAVLASLLWVACGTATTTTPVRFGAGPLTHLEGLAACAPTQPAQQVIDPDRPLTVLVHGCSSSGGRFRSLANVFELHGQQTACFNYNDRDSLRASGQQLRRALNGLRRRMRHGEVTILGHSQGGLVARAALSEPVRPASDTESPPTYRLVTISSPFAGIQAASDCGSLALHILTLGITVAVCQVVTGSKWGEIHPSAGMVTAPQPLWPAVSSHLSIVTDERGTCRKQAMSGCEESDFVFEVAEQSNRLLLDDTRVTQTTIAAGHVEIVGQAGMSPRKLIRALQRHGVLRPTPPALKGELSSLLGRLF